LDLEKKNKNQFDGRIVLMIIACIVLYAITLVLIFSSP
jgi:hypothetical protein